MNYRCPLGIIQPNRPDVEAIKHDAWHNDGFLVVHVDDPKLNWLERQVINTIGEKLHGKSGTKYR